MVAILKWSGLGVLGLLLAACTSSTPYRTEANKDKQCPIKTASTDCPALTPEVNDLYELHFVEFDDQGWLHPEGSAKGGQASEQLDVLMRSLTAKTEQQKDLSIVVYVHGWKHNASPDDGDVGKFRKLLALVRAFELSVSRERPRDVVGIYVGWRGRSLDLGEPWINVTFWDRKATALRVAQGSVRELFARLNGLQRYNNRDCATGTAHPRPRCKVRMLLIGHSFGAWILYSAIGESLIEALSAERDVKDRPPSATRFADLVVLVNPAFEASRYEPLHRASEATENPTYQAPLLVSVTSTADWATRYAFPLGRIFSTILQRPTSSDKQAEAISKTPGHIDRYITHELVVSSADTTTECKGWQPVIDPSPEQLSANIAAERENAKDFFKHRFDPAKGGPSLAPGWSRDFCGGSTLRHLKYHQHAPVWNIRTNKDLVASHTDITGDAFVGFIRQLYHDITEVQ